MLICESAIKSKLQFFHFSLKPLFPNLETMAMKSVLIFLSVAVMAISTAEAQNPLGIIHVNGTLYCSIDGRANAPATPVFPNAQVGVQCTVPNLATVLNATTDGSGSYRVYVFPNTTDISAILSNCNVFVTTPLSNCNVNLPSVGGLRSSLQFVRTTSIGFFRVTYLIAAGFRYVSTFN